MEELGKCQGLSGSQGSPSDHDSDAADAGSQSGVRRSGVLAGQPLWSRPAVPCTTTRWQGQPQESMIFSTEPWGLSLMMPISEASRTAAVGSALYWEATPLPPPGLEAFLLPQATLGKVGRHRGALGVSGRAWTGRAGRCGLRRLPPSVKG